jgi:hypothetical protein
MPACPACAALNGMPADTSPHANLLLHSEAGINFGATATGTAEYYICNACGSAWERDRARSEPNAVWKPASKPLR